MFYIALNTMFNAFLLSIVFTLGVHLGSKPTPETYLFIVILSYTISTLLTLIGFSRIGSTLIGLFVRARSMIGRERAILEPLFSDVIERTNREYGTNYKLADFKIKVSDDKTVNAFALGYNILVVNRGAFESLKPEQLRAVLAHEMGHLYYRDSVKTISLVFSAYATRVVMTIYSMFMVAAAAFTNNSRGSIQGVSLIAYYIIFIGFLPVIFLNWLGNKVFTIINRKISRSAEYRADAFSASLGYKADMISALELFDKFGSGNDNSFIGKLMSTHPAAITRIGALEDDNIAKDSIGNLFVATPFAKDNSSQVSSNRDFTTLTIILCIFGVVWIGSTAFDKFTRTELRAEGNIIKSELSESPAKTTQPASTTKSSSKRTKKANIPHNQVKASTQKQVATQQNDSMVHITNVYKVSENNYTVTYTYRGTTSTRIVHSQPTSNTITLSQLQSL